MPDRLSGNIEFTWLKKAGGKVTKQIEIDADGTIHSDSSQCWIARGAAMRKTLGLCDFARLIGSLGDDEALCLGALRDDLPRGVPIASRHLIASGAAANGAIARTSENIVYCAAPSLVLLDHDLKGMPESVRERLRDLGGFEKAIENVCPAIADAGMILRQSTSAGLIDVKTGAPCTGSGGLHAYLPINDGTDAKRLGDALHKRCWLHGLGWFIVGKNGALLERSIIDRSVFAGERIVFEANPELGPGLRQERREATVRDGGFLDTKAECRDLSKAEQGEFDRLRGEAEKRLEVECRVRRAAFIEERIAASIARGASPEAARHAAEAWTRGVLMPEAVIEFDDGESATVRAIRANPQRYAERTCADPIEGHAYGRGKARLFIKDNGEPVITSHAHGFKTVYGLHGDDSEASEAAPAFSDEAIALKFAEQHAGDLRLVAKWGKWFRWTGTYWQSDETLGAFYEVRKTCRAVARECNKSAGAIASAKTVSAVERLAKADPRLVATTDQFDADPWALNTPAGIVDLRTGIFRSHRPADYHTKITAVGPADTADCPLFLKFLREIMNGDAELVAYLQRMLGYFLTGSTCEHALFFLYGTGFNGKGVLTRTVAGILGDYHRVAPMETFVASKNERHPTELAGLRGARVVTANETEAGQRWAESKIKNLTGEDKITARHMRQDFFDYVPQFKLCISGNHKPSLHSVDEAIRNRFHLIPFTRTIDHAERDPELTEKLKTEWPGILRWMIDGCLAWQTGGLQMPSAVREATDTYLQSEDAIATWIEESCVCKVQAWESNQALFASFQEWAKTHGEFAGTQKRLSQALIDRKFRAEKKNGKRGFAGLRLMTPNG